MRTLRRLIFGEIFRAVGFVTVGFLALFFFFDFVDALQSVGRGGGQLRNAALYVLLLIPSHLYDLLPIAVLIGSIFVMARLAQSSEYTILRTSGLGPWRALGTLTLLGLVFVVLTFAVGDYLAPLGNRAAQLMKARIEGRISLGHSGAWIKDRQAYSSYSVNVGALASDGTMHQVRIFEFDNQGFIVSITQAPRASFGQDDSWLLEDADRREFQTRDTDKARVSHAHLATFRWPTQLSGEMVAAAVISPDRMKTLDLFQYIRHLQANGQSAQRYEIEFWRKVFYPLSCLVMMVLALPFAYLHFRSGNITGYVFGGVMAGISFFLLNNVFGFMGNLQNWQPWITAAAPGLIYTLVSLGAFGWLVLRR